MNQWAIRSRCNMYGRVIVVQRLNSSRFRIDLEETLRNMLAGVHLRDCITARTLEGNEAKLLTGQPTNVDGCRLLSDVSRIDATLLVTQM